MSARSEAFRTPMWWFSQMSSREFTRPEFIHWNSDIWKEIWGQFLIHVQVSSVEICCPRIRVSGQNEIDERKTWKTFVTSGISIIWIIIKSRSCLIDILYIPLVLPSERNIENINQTTSGLYYYSYNEIDEIMILVPG